MSIQVNGANKRIGLALSGGGFRAAAFHLGVMRELAAFGLLDKIDLFTCVSGGSIAGATVALNWSRADKLDLLEQFLSSRSIAVSSVLGGALDPFSSRIEKLAQSYDTHLFQNRRMSSFKAGPRIYLNATNLATGNLFFFVAGGGQDTVMGEHELGTSSASDFPISHAVAASSAFPRCSHRCASTPRPTHRRWPPSM
ncbi:patatin-like phospholipase family protein [Azotobacter sp. CWF10]